MVICYFAVNNCYEAFYLKFFHSKKISNINFLISGKFPILKHCSIKMEIFIYSDDGTNVKVLYLNYLNYHLIPHLARSVHSLPFDL